MERDADHWRARLPETLLEHVVWPIRVQAVSDDTVPVAKWRGVDALGLLCYYRHRYSRWTAELDDEDATSIELDRQEELEAWRTLLGTWVRRVQRVRRVPCGPDGAHELRVDAGFELVTAREIPRL